MSFTPLDISPFAGIFSFLGRAIPIAWLLLLCGCLAWALFGASNAPSRIVRVLAVLLLVVVWPGWYVLQWRQRMLVEKRRKDIEHAVFERRKADAEYLFIKRCEAAGETIRRTENNVRGVVWMKWRPRRFNHGSQFRMDDPYGHYCGEEECIELLLRSTFEEPHTDVIEIDPPKQGYEFVETEDPRDGLLYRYTAGVMKAGERSAEKRAEVTNGPYGADPGPFYYRFNIRREPIQYFTARYGITWDDISTRRDREHWIAGGALSIIDMKTSQLVAKRVGYMWDIALGGTAGFRSPWAWASSHADCSNWRQSSIRFDSSEAMRSFVFRVLQPAQGVTNP